VADALVHREDDDPLGERDAQLISPCRKERPVATDEVLEFSLSLSALSAGSWSTAQPEILVYSRREASGSWPPS
jgi:hypothetical protein